MRAKFKNWVMRFCEQLGFELDGFKNGMPQIFTDFNWDKFVETYNSLRIEKNTNEK